MSCFEDDKGKEVRLVVFGFSPEQKDKVFIIGHDGFVDDIVEYSIFEVVGEGEGGFFDGSFGVFFHAFYEEFLFGAVGRDVQKGLTAEEGNKWTIFLLGGQESFLGLFTGQRTLFFGYLFQFS